MFAFISDSKFRTRIGSILVATLSAIAAQTLSSCSSRTITPQMPASGAQSTPNPTASTNARPATPRYSIVDLGTLGGSFSQANGVNNNGTVAGFSRTGADTTCCDTFLWRKGVIRNLGAGGFLGSEAPENNPINDRDEISSSLDTGIPDPSGEDFCGFSGHICIASVWRDGVFRKLPILGGHNASAFAINDRGEVVGWAESGIAGADDLCFAGQVFHLVGAFWSNKGTVRELAPLPGDPDALAIGLNDKGEVAGASGTCTGSRATAVIWRNGTPRSLPSLGGVQFNLAIAINNNGDVAGASNLAGDRVQHAALWHNGLVTDLGTLPGLPISSANGVNNSSQVVGFSQDFAGNTLATLWQNGAIYNLNDLITANSGLFAIEAVGINNRGQIAGYAFSSAAGDVHGFLATPEYGQRIARTKNKSIVTLPPDVRECVRRNTVNPWHRHEASILVSPVWDGLR